MNVKLSPFSTDIPYSHVKHFPQSSPIHNISTATQSSVTNDLTIPRKDSQNSQDSNNSSQDNKSRFNQPFLVVFPSNLPPPNGAKNEFSASHDEISHPIGYNPQPVFLNKKLRSQTDFEPNFEPISPGARQKPMMIPRSQTLTVLQPIAEKNETPRDDMSSDVTECTSPESNYQDVRIVGQTLLQRWDESDKASQGKLSNNATPLSVKTTTVPAYYGNSRPTMQLQNLSSCPSIFPRNEGSNPATLKIPPLVVPMNMNNMASTQASTAKRNLFSELDDEDDMQPQRQGSNLFPARSRSLNVIPSLFAKKQEHEISINSQIPVQRVLDFSNDKPPMAFPSRSEQVQSALHKPVARNLFSEIEHEEALAKEFSGPKISILGSEQKPAQLQIPKGFTFEGHNNQSTQNNVPSGNSTPLNVSYLSSKIFNSMNNGAFEPDYCRSAVLQSKTSKTLFQDNEEEESKGQYKPINLLQIKSLPHPSRSASENNLPFISNKYNNNTLNIEKPMEAQNSQLASRVLDFEDNEPEIHKPSFSLSQSASAMLKTRNLFSEVGEEEQQLIHQSRFNKTNFTIGRCCSENNIPSTFQKNFQNVSICNPDSTSSCTMLKALSFDSDDNGEIAQENNLMQNAFQANKEVQNSFLQPSGYLKVEKISSSPISVGHQYGEQLFINQKHDYRPNLPSQFAPNKNFQRSNTEIYSPGIRSGARTRTFISEKENDSFRTDDSECRLEQDFEIKESLGTGIFTVFKCKNKLDGQIYAVKCTHNKVKDENNIDKILSLIQLNPSADQETNNYHVRYYNSWKDEDGNLFVVMEYCLGNLSDNNSNKSEEDVKNILRDICSALKPIHAQNQGHCHIKPENILLSNSGKWKLGDLGLANLGYQIKVNSDESVIDDILNDAMYYFSPELEECEGQDLDLTRCDMFSLGLVMAEFMMGIKLREHQITRDNLKRGNFAELESLNYSNELIKIVKNMLSEDPEERPSAEGLLEGFLQKGIQNDIRNERRSNEALKANVEGLKAKLGVRRKKSF